METPVLIDAVDWTDERRIFSVLVWPPVEVDDEAIAGHYERVQQVKQVIARGASDMALTTLLETDYGLKWDHDRKVWVTSGSFAYDGTLERDVA